MLPKKRSKNFDRTRDTDGLKTPQDLHSPQNSRSALIFRLSAIAARLVSLIYAIKFLTKYITIIFNMWLLSAVLLRFATLLEKEGEKLLAGTLST